MAVHGIIPVLDNATMAMVS